MRSQRNNWLTGLSREEFAQLDPWEVVCHPESRPQWIAEVRSKLRVSLTDDEILSILQIGLYKAVASAIELYQDVEPHQRAAHIIGAALNYIRWDGRGDVLAEVPGSSAINMGDLVTELGPRSHSLQSDYMLATAQFGVYSSPEEVLALLEERGISREVAIAKGYILVEENNPSKYRRTMNNRVIGYWPHPDGDFRLWGRLPSGKGDRWNKKYMFADSLKKDTPYLFSMRKPGPLIAVEGTFDGWSIQFMGFWGTAIGQASINAGQAAFLAGEGVTEVAHMVDGDIAGYEGGIVSIRNCEPAGIVTAIVPLGQGMDDPDALRKAGRTAEFEKLIASRMNAGEFLARMCHTYASESPPNISGIRKIHAIIPMLTPVSTKHWKDWSQTLGVSEPKDVASVRLLSSLVDGGFDLDEALALVLKRTGFRITLTQETVNG